MTQVRPAAAASPFRYPVAAFAGLPGHSGSQARQPGISPPVIGPCSDSEVTG